MMDFFSNLAVFVSLILAVAISRGLEGMAYLIGQRSRVTWNWVFITWGIFFVVACATQWWDFIANWRLSPSFSLYEFLFMLASPIVLFFLPAVLFHSFPQAGPIDLWAHFEGVRAWVYTLAAVHVSLYVVSSAILAAKKGMPFFSEMPVAQLVATLAIAALLQAGAFVRRRPYDRSVVIVVVALFVILYAFLA
jgi:hypothetical protein